MGVGIAGGKNLIGDGPPLDRRKKVVSGSSSSAEKTIMRRRESETTWLLGLFYAGESAWGGFAGCSITISPSCCKLMTLASPRRAAHEALARRDRPSASCRK